MKNCSRVAMGRESLHGCGQAGSKIAAVRATGGIFLTAKWESLYIIGYEKVPLDRIVPACGGMARWAWFERPSKQPVPRPRGQTEARQDCLSGFVISGSRIPRYRS